MEKAIKINLGNRSCSIEIKELPLAKIETLDYLSSEVKNSLRAAAINACPEDVQLETFLEIVTDKLLL